MTSFDVTDDGWEWLGEHSGVVTSLVWSSDGASLYSGSYDGEIRKWSGDRAETLRPSGSGPVFGLTWSALRNELLASSVPDLTVYGNKEGVAYGINAQAISCDPTGRYVATREWISGGQTAPSRPRLRIRATEALETPILDSDLFQRNGDSGFDFAWHPNGRLLAVLADGTIGFVSSNTLHIFDHKWQVGLWANAIAWISSDELVVAFGDANIRTYSREANPAPGYGQTFTLRTRTVLENHAQPVVSIAVGCAGTLFVTADLEGHVHAFSSEKQLLGSWSMPSVQHIRSPRLALHPTKPLLAVTTDRSIYRRVLTIPAAGREKARPVTVVKPDPISRLLARAGLDPAEELTADEVARRWGVSFARDGEEVLPRALEFREIRSIVRDLCNRISDCLRALWSTPDHSLKVVLERTLRSQQGPSREEDSEKLRGSLRSILEERHFSADGQSQVMALCAYTWLSNLDRLAYLALAKLTAYEVALDSIRDDEARAALWSCFKPEAELRSAAEVRAHLELVRDSIVKVLGNIRPTEPEKGAMAMRDILVVAAPQELKVVREKLRELGFQLRTSQLHEWRLDLFELPGCARGNLLVGLMFPLAKGKEEMRSLLEEIRRHPQVENVIMVGMMAGLKGKTNLLDVVVPFSVYDVSPVGTKKGALVLEPETGTMDPTLHHWVAASESDWHESLSIKVICHKRTLNFSAKIDDVEHELAQLALKIDAENTVGLEMEASALAATQTRAVSGPRLRYLMIKGVADYAGGRIGDEEARALGNIDEIKDHLDDRDPNSPRLKSVLQRVATRRALTIAIELLKILPDKSTTSSLER